MSRSHKQGQAGLQSLEAAKSQSPQWPHARSFHPSPRPPVASWSWASPRWPGPPPWLPGDHSSSSHPSWASSRAPGPPRPSTPARPHPVPQLPQPSACTVVHASCALLVPSLPGKMGMLPSCVSSDIFLCDLHLLPPRHGSGGGLVRILTALCMPLNGRRAAWDTECSWSSSPVSMTQPQVTSPEPRRPHP